MITMSSWFKVAKQFNSQKKLKWLLLSFTIENREGNEENNTSFTFINVHYFSDSPILLTSFFFFDVIDFCPFNSISKSTTGQR